VSWAEQISARQRALDGGPAAAPATAPAYQPPQQAAPQHFAPQQFAPQHYAPQHDAPQPMAHAAAPASWGPPADLAEVEHQLREINSQISSLHQPYENTLAALRGEIAEIGQLLTEAMPRRAIEALENEIRALAERVDHSRQAGADGAALGTLEQEIAEVRHALQHLTPAENLAGFHEAVQALSYKIDQIAEHAGAAQDPIAFKQLEQAVVSLRGVVSNVASDGALEQLAAEVRGLGAQFERAAADSSAEALGRLESRIATLLESGRAMPPELEGSIRDLNTKLDRMTLSQGDQLALTALEDRIAKLSEKLDASDARLGSLAAIERGMAELLVHLEEMRAGKGFRAPQPPEPAPQPVAPPPTAPAAPAAAPATARSALDLLTEQPQSVPPAPASPPAQVHVPAAPVAMATPADIREKPPVKQPPRGPVRPINPDLPGDAPLEPGSGAPRLKPGSAAARIAASEAALGNSRGMPSETGGRLSAIVAARNAAKAAYLDTPVKVPKSLGVKGGFFKWPFKKKADEAETVVMLPPTQILPQTPSPAATPEPMPEPTFDDSAADLPPTRGRRILKLVKTVLVAASVAIIVLGTVQTAMELLFPDKPAGSGPESSAPKASAPATRPSRPMPTPEGTLPPLAPTTPAPGTPAPKPPAADNEPTNSIGGRSLFDPATIIKLPEVTGSIPRKPAPAKTPPVAAAVNADKLPASISPMLRTALLANNPAAEYELGARYAEGRGVTQNMAEAAVWMQRAADAGFVPAQFRLASLYEKGEGVTKDPQAARRLYLDAAKKGHGKAMHNLAVLYAEGIDGKPDYKSAAEWFRKAASYGVTDSQYNLAILYARGIGVQANMAEAYRWFALAAANGDQDAARKRDEVASRLDQKTLTAAKLAAQTFTAEPEPDEAVNLNAPLGGWDHTPAQPVKPRRNAPPPPSR
jgi:localization factor PodJL